eukprot:1362141-Amorphochlora_amoeboformis.AAC.2
MAAAQRAVQEAQGLCRRIEELQDTHKGIGAKVLIVQRNIEKVKANISRLGAQKQEEQDQVMRLFKRRAENEIRDLEYRERESVRQNYNSSRRAKLRTFKREVHTAKSKLTEACNNRINALALLQAQIDAFGDSSEVYEEREQKKLERERQLMSFDKRNKSLEEEEKQLVQKLSQAKVKNDSARYEMSVEEEEQASLRSKSLGYSVDQVTELSEKKRNTTAVVVDLHSKLQVLKGKISFMQRQERKRKQASLSWQFTRDNKTKRLNIIFILTLTRTQTRTLTHPLANPNLTTPLLVITILFR